MPSTFLRPLYAASRLALISLLMALSSTSLADEQANKDMLLDAIAGKVDVNSSDALGRPLVITAIATGDQNALTELLARGANPDADYLGVPALFFTVSDSCSSEPLSALLEAKADIAQKDGFMGSTALHFAAQHRDTRCLALLIQHGADVNASDNEGRTPYFYAVDFANADGINKLWDAGSHPAKRNKRGYDVFHYAILQEQAPLVRELLINYLEAPAQTAPPNQ